jgi:hypothetical protein
MTSSSWDCMPGPAPPTGPALNEISIAQVAFASVNGSYRRALKRTFAQWYGNAKGRSRHAVTLVYQIADRKVQSWSGQGRIRSDT